ncbi:MAG: ATP-binding protein, partial [Planctomycetota bacterium]
LQLRPGGSTGPTVRVVSGPLLDLEDEPVGAILLLSDITQLRQLESVRSDFAANVSHELRTPITNIKGYVETLLDDGLTDRERAMGFLEIVRRNAERLGAIVDDMLALTNLERSAGKELPVAPTPADTLVHSVIAQVKPEVTQKVMTVQAAGLVDDAVLVNARLAEQAIINLVLNAVKYAPVSTAITLRSSRDTLPGDRPGVRIEVADEGPGIEPHHLPRLFERFYRVDKARSRQEGGTGLGLSIVKHIARVHGGDAGVSSVVGVGSRFWLVFPSAHAHPRAEREAPESVPA